MFLMFAKESIVSYFCKKRLKNINKNPRQNKNKKYVLNDEMQMLLATLPT